MKNLSYLSLAIIIMLSSCNKHDWHGEINGTFNGSRVAMFSGNARTWIIMNNGVPKQLGLSIDDAAMNSLPADGEFGYETVLPLPFQANVTPFDHVVLGWNPHGHEPEGIYTVPHFDFHFYMISPEQRMSIPPFEVDSSEFQNFPAPQYLPPTYFPIPGGVPMMGTHWADGTAPELNGQPFTQTFLFGSYGGRVTFYEPMITKAFIDATTTFKRHIPQPQAFEKNSFYPTTMSVNKHDGVTDIVLEGFVPKSSAN